MSLPVPTADRGVPILRSRVAFALGLWAAWYAAYRFYYAFGGHAGMVGRPASAAEFRRINLVGGTIILLAVMLPPIAISAWRHRSVRKFIPVVGWIAAVGCCVHALTDVTQDAFSLTGLHAIHYPAGFWSSIDRREAALQDAVFNEPWFLVEGCLWGAFALIGLQPSSRRPWLRSAVIVGVLAYAFGVLTGLGVAPSFRYG
jgi:hypothetical protein